MKLHTFTLHIAAFALLAAALVSCGPDDSSDYKEVSPVVADLNVVPYPKLSDYHFFEGEMKNLEPVYKVIPYDLNSSLFTDYAHKKRFIWMPEGVKATYNGDGKVLEFPTGTILIKNFYYDNVLPANTTRILETRLMIRKSTGWIFADYIWNTQQTEATLNMDGSYVDLSWTQNGATMNATYRIPSGTECLTCHKSSDIAIPIGPKPQNLNKNYTYANGSQNQLERWKAEGYLDEAVPQNIASTVDWTDTSKPLDLRVRSYLDINCAHCHSEGAHCSYRVMRFAFSESTTDHNLGICIAPQENINPSLSYIIARKNVNRSAVHYRLNTTVEAERMPLLGRTIVHTEALEMIDQWINGMDAPCP
jgi:uncharacterized repeat protein (TIGR03806 family)